jgi:phage terminase large subunit
MDEVEINESFKPLYESNKRYFFLTSGRAGLKSSTVHDFIARLTYERGHGVLFTRYTMNSAEKSIIPEFRIVLSRLDIEKDFNVTKNVVTNLRTGSFIYFSGIKTSSGNQTANLKSIAGITTWVIEEGEDFQDERTFDTIDDSIRTKQKQNRVIWIQNPSTKEHFIYKRWIEKANKKIDISGYDVTVSNDPGVEHIHTWYGIARKFLSKEWLNKAEKAKRDNPKWYYHNYIGGWLEKAEGVIFDNWQEGDFDQALPYCYGLDYGFNPDPLGLVKVAVNKKEKKVYIKEYAYTTKLSTEQVADLFRDSLRNPRDLIICDTNESRTTADLRKEGFNLKEAKKNRIIDDIRELQGYTFIVDPNSSNLKKELNNYIWNDKKSSTPIDDWNHLIDPTRYAFNQLVRRGISKSTVIRR